MKNLSLNLLSNVGSNRDHGSNQIRPIVMVENLRKMVDKIMAEAGDIRLPVIIVVSLVTSAHSAISLLEWEEICTHCLHNFPNRSNDYVIEIKGDTCSSGLI